MKKSSTTLFLVLVWFSIFLFLLIIAGTKKAVVELKPMLMDLTFNNIMRMMTGKRYYGEETTDEEEAKRVRKLVADVGANTSSGNAVDYVPILRLFSSYENRVKKLGEETDKFLQGLIDDKRGQQETGTTMIDHLLVLQKSDIEYYTDQIIKGIILVYFFFLYFFLLIIRSFVNFDYK